MWWKSSGGAVAHLLGDHGLPQRPQGSETRKDEGVCPGSIHLRERADGEGGLHTDLQGREGQEGGSGCREQGREEVRKGRQVTRIVLYPYPETTCQGRQRS